MKKPKQAKAKPATLKDVLKKNKEAEHRKRSVESLGAHAGVIPADRKLSSGTPWREKRRLLTEQEFLFAGSSVLNGTIEDVTNILQSEDATLLEKMNARLALNGLKGDVRAFNALIDQTLGRIRSGVDLEKATSGNRIIIALPDNGRSVKDFDIIEAEVES